MQSPATLRIATWNVCWFNDLFDRDDRLVTDNQWSSMHDVTRARQAEAIALVMRRLDADLLAVIEAPNTGRRRDTVKALEGFAAWAGLRQVKAMIGFPSETHQEIALLYDPARVSARHDPLGLPIAEGEAASERPFAAAPRFDGMFAIDLDGDGQVDRHRFSKPPLEAEVHVRGPDRRFRLIAVHAKSKAPHGAANAEEEARIALTNRRKHLAQCAWLRARIDEHLDRGDDVIALGDFNDGPGVDKYERVFGRSGVEVVIGDPSAPERRLVTPFLGRSAPSAPRPATARFYSEARGGFVNALLDFVMLSRELAASTNPRWRIWHPFDDGDCYADEALRQALLDASDHFPVAVDLQA